MDYFNYNLIGKVVGAQVVVYSHGKTYAYCYGKSSLMDNKDVTDDTIFRLASISKVLVAIAALKLMESGLLNIDQDIGQILGFDIRNPKYPDTFITSKMLMLHTSSITDGYLDNNLEHNGIEKGYNGVNGKHYFVKLKDLLSNKDSNYYLEQTFSTYAPGQKFIYSNFGTGILACIIEKVTGRLFTAYINDLLFKPLDISASFKPNNIDQRHLISDTFYYDSKIHKFETNVTAKRFIERSYPDFDLGNNFRGPAGGCYMSMMDLSKVMRMLMHDGSYDGIEILKKSTVDLMLQMHYLGPDAEYLAKGLQLKFIDYMNHQMLKGHTGSAYGVTSFMFFSKEADYGVCFIANGGDYKDSKPDLNDVEYNVLSDAYVYYQGVNKIVTIYPDHHVDLNGRGIYLNHYKVVDDRLLLSILDLANVLDCIPRLIDGMYYIHNQAVEFLDELIDLEVVLDKLKITYEKLDNTYKIYLTI